MIRCVRIVPDGQGGSLFQEGRVALAEAKGGSASPSIPAHSISFHETPPHSGSGPHDAPTRQIVLSLSGTVTVRTPAGQEVTIRPGDALLAEDVEGSGHSWQLVDDEPWRRAYIVVDNIDALFEPG